MLFGFRQGGLQPVAGLWQLYLWKRQNDKLKFLCFLISGTLSPCMLLHIIYCTLGPHQDTTSTELSGLQQSWWNRVIHESYVIDIKSETHTHISGKYTKKTEVKWVNCNIFTWGLSSCFDSFTSMDGGVGISQTRSWFVSDEQISLLGHFRYLFCLFTLKVPVKNVLLCSECWLTSGFCLHDAVRTSMNSLN